MSRLGGTIWFTGLSGAGKTTVATLVHEMLIESGAAAELLDGDVIRENISKGLGFSREDRDTNVRRIGWICGLLARHGVITCVAAISPYEETREEIRRQIGRFVLVHCTAPLAVLEQRDVKGLYRRARAGEIKHFTGVDDPYEVPRRPDVVVVSDGEENPVASARRVLAAASELVAPALRVTGGAGI